MLFDTSAYILLFKENPEVIRELKGVKNIVIPVVVLAELEVGFMLGSNMQKRQEIFATFLSSSMVSVLDITSDTSAIYAKIACDARKTGKNNSHNDMWIAALALQHNLPVLTSDKDFSRIKMLTDKKLLRLVQV